MHAIMLVCNYSEGLLQRHSLEAEPDVNVLPSFGWEG